MKEEHFEPPTGGEDHNHSPGRSPKKKKGGITCFCGNATFFIYGTAKDLDIQCTECNAWQIWD